MANTQLLSLATPEGADNASQQVRGCAAGTLTGREPACELPPITSRHLHGQMAAAVDSSGIHHLSRHDALSAPSHAFDIRRFAAKVKGGAGNRIQL